MEAISVSRIAVLVTALKCLRSVAKSIVPLALANRHRWRDAGSVDLEELEEVFSAACDQGGVGNRSRDCGGFAHPVQAAWLSG